MRCVFAYASACVPLVYCVDACVDITASVALPHATVSFKAHPPYDFPWRLLAACLRDAWVCSLALQRHRPACLSPPSPRHQASLSLLGHRIPGRRQSGSLRIDQTSICWTIAFGATMLRLLWCLSALRQSHPSASWHPSQQRLLSTQTSWRRRYASLRLG